MSFYEYVVYDNGCWLYTGRHDKAGYGRYGSKLVHRLAYEDAYGATPKELDHLCRNRACCNPLHLEPVTRSENIRRSIRNQPQLMCKRGHSFAETGYIWKGRRWCGLCRRRAMAARAREHRKEYKAR